MRKKIFWLIIITLILELFIFNFRYFVVKFANLQNEKITAFEELEKKEEEGKISQQIIIPLSKQINSVKLNFNKSSDESIEVNVQFVDEGEKYAFKKYNDFYYNKNFKNSEYFVLNSQGKCQTMYLYFTSTDDFKLENIEVNTWYYEFNILRFVVILGIGLLILYYKNINRFFEKNKKIRIAIYIAILLVAIIIYGIFCFKWQENNLRFSISGNMVRSDPYNLLTESILHGRIDLNYTYEGTPIDEEKIENLLILDNTKDISERIKEETLYYFDTAFFNGKYYCYYGIVPVLTVMLPIAVLTGIIVFSNVPCFIYGSILIVMILLIYFEVLKRLKIKLGFIFELGLYITLFLATGISILMASPNFYQAADMSGLAWGLIGIYLILRIDNNKNVLLKLMFSGISFGLMVCSRPIYVLYFIIYVILVYKHIVKNKKIDVKRLLYFSIPIMIIALLQMLYNYARYENIFEFGQFYQLTINDPSQQKMDIGMSINGLIVYLFNLPKFVETFPYIDIIFIPVQNGNLIYNEGVFGLVCYLFLWIMVLGWKMLKDNKTVRNLWIATIIISILCFSINTCLAGINQRYTIDVQPIIAIISFVIWMKYLKKYNIDTRSKNLLIYVSIFTCIISVLITLFEIGEVGTILGVEAHSSRILYMLKHALIFYK